MKRDVLSVVLLLITNATIVIASNSNEILLKSRRFTPIRGITAATKAKIETIPQRAHVLIQLEKTPTIKERRELEAQGIKLLSYVPNRAWFASIPSDRAGGRVKGEITNRIVLFVSDSGGLFCCVYCV